MKKTLLIAIIAATISAASQAQTPFTAMDSLDINNINSGILVHGDMWWNPNSPDYSSQCTFPNGSGKHANFASAIWMSGYDAGNQLHIAAQTYRQSGNDYWPGPLDVNDTLVLSTSSQWAKIWKVNRTDINAFILLSSHTVANTPPAILTWPGKGNVNAQGNLGAMLTINTDMAPFVDLNGNGIYEPLLGEYPDVPGDQALWWVFSDNGPAHTQSHGKPLGVEVHALAYAYAHGTLMDNVQYYSYTIINKSANNYSGFRFGLHDDVNIGYYADDYIGFDSTWRMGYTYNGEPSWDGASAGAPVDLSEYDSMPPIVGVTLVDVPGDAGTSYIPAGSFTYYNNDFSIIGNPVVDTEYNNYLRAKLRNGTHFTNDFTGAHHPTKGYASGPNTNYVYSGEPGDTSQWSECNCSNNFGDRRSILTTSDFSLNAGSQQKVVMALVITPLDSFHVCPLLNHFNDIRVVADTAWAVYHNPPPVLPAGINTMSVANIMKIYPNPADDQVTVVLPGNIIATLSVFNAIGQEVPVPILRRDNVYQLDIKSLRAGVYLMRINDEKESKTMTFVKR